MTTTTTMVNLMLVFVLVIPCMATTADVDLGNNEPSAEDLIESPVPLEGLTFSLKRDLNPCQSSLSDRGQNSDHDAGDLCDVTTTRVFSSRYR